MSDDETRGLHLSDKQLVFVFMAATVTAVVVFLFGVLVGRGVHGTRGPGGDTEMTAAAGEVVPDRAPEEAPAADAASRRSGGGPGLGDLSYPERLGKNPPAERLRPAPSASDDALRAIAPPEVPEEPIAPVAAPGGTAAQQLSRPAGAPAPAAAPPAGAYTVQVAAVSRREEADGIVKHLKTKRYDAYVVAPGPGDTPAVFRVRIGSFKDKRRADMLAEQLLREDKRYKPWVTR
ncbi:MAG: SPOR domain-containing protein [Vicinamibacterales bacterium]